MRAKVVPLTQAGFHVFAKDFLGAVVSVLEEKGRQYSPESAIDNFVRGGANFSNPPAEDLLVKANKHWDALCQWSAGHRDFFSGAVTERVKDLIVYLLLLAFMVNNHCTGVDSLDHEPEVSE